jgi:hypothetical protein
MAKPRHQVPLVNVDLELSQSSLDRLFQDCEVIEEDAYAVAIPLDAPEDLRIKVIAAVKAWLLGLSSADSVRKRYGAAWQKPRIDKHLQLHREMQHAVRYELARVFFRLNAVANAPKPQSVTLGAMALTRTLSSFSAANILFRMGFLFEGFSICRIILEQVSWAHAIQALDDAAIKRCSPQTTIGTLREVVPYAGRFYGSLSQMAHLSPRVMPLYARTSDPNPSVILRSSRACNAAAIVLVDLYDCFSIVTEIIFRNVLDHFEHIKVKKDGSVSLRQCRKGVQLRRRFHRRLEVPEEYESLLSYADRT